jgi:tRNA pseudouridine65 synthase
MDRFRNPWQTLSAQPAYDNPWIRVEHHRVVQPAGGEGIYGKIHFKHRAIGVIPVDPQGFTWLVGQHRYPLDAWSWEIPEGGGAMDEEPADAARRELREEVGLATAKLTEILRLHLSNSVSDEEAIIFLAENLSPVPPAPDDTERLEIRHLPLRDALRMVMDGAITDAMSVAGLLKMSLLGRIPDPVPIVHRDDWCAVVDKPSGVVVHRGPDAPDRDALLQRVRDQVGAKVYPVNRLDRPTSGLVLFALGQEQAAAFCALFQEREVEKVYYAVVRGWIEEAGVIDYPVRTAHSATPQPAVTAYRRLATAELPVAVGPYPTARYSLVELRPQTGRLHQLRRHCAHLRHPIIGDTTYGDPAHNRLFRARIGCGRLLLHAARLAFVHPFTGTPASFACSVPGDFRNALAWLGIPPPGPEEGKIQNPKSENRKPKSEPTLKLED